MLKGTVRTVIALKADENGKLPKRIQIFPEGAYETMPYGKLVFDKNVFSQMIANFKADVRKAVPVDVDHDGGKAAGWIDDLEHEEGNGMWASVEWTKYGKQLLLDKIYKLFSPEWAFDYVDPQNSTRHGATLIAGSLTNRPLFKNMEALVANDGTTPQGATPLTVDDGIAILISNSKKEASMNLEELLKKDLAELTAEEKEFIKQHASELSDEDKAKYDFLTADEGDEDYSDAEGNEGEEADGEESDGDEDEGGEGEDEGEGDEEANKGSEDTVTLKASEVESMKAKLQKFEAKEAQAKMERKVAKFVANEDGGKLLPKMKASVVEFAMTLTADQQSKFFEVVKALPDVKVAGEKGDSEGEAKTAKEQVLALIEKYKADEKLSEDKAQDMVQRKHPELWAEYRSEE